MAASSHHLGHDPVEKGFLQTEGRDEKQRENKRVQAVPSHRRWCTQILISSCETPQEQAQLYEAIYPLLLLGLGLVFCPLELTKL